MEIDQKLDDLFGSMSPTSKEKNEQGNHQDKNRDLTVVELKQLEFKLNQHLKKTQGKSFQHVSVFPQHHPQECLDTFVDREFHLKYASKKWHALPQCLKWKYAQAYIDENHLDDTTKKNIKTLIQKNRHEHFTYDHANQKILDITV